MKKSADKFDRANTLWHLDGRTNKALDSYQEARRDDPDDPVIAYQLGVAHWGFGEIDEARAQLRDADALRERLSDLGKKVLDERIHQLENWSGFKHPLPFPPRDLDVDRLDRARLTPTDIYGILPAARERELFGVAAWLLTQTNREFTDLDLLRDVDDVEYEAKRALALLDAMRADYTVKPVSGESISTPQTRADSFDIIETDSPRPAVQPVLSPATSDGPLRLEAMIDPSTCEVGQDIMLRCLLKNVFHRPIVVNKRLLYNRRNVPPEFGDLYATVSGPPGYENRIRFSIRVGQPEQHHYGILRPGELVERQLPLTKYESLHLPGQYQVQIAYRNVTARSVDGLPAFVGEVRSRPIPIERTGPPG